MWYWTFGINTVEFAIPKNAYGRKIYINASREKNDNSCPLEYLAYKQGEGTSKKVLLF